MSKFFLNASPDDLKAEWKRMMPEQGQNAEQMYDGCRKPNQSGSSQGSVHVERG
jgi:hypothetical protein